MATITFNGLASGLDTSSWVEALVSVKQTTITSLQNEQKVQQDLLSVVNNIRSYFTSFQTALQKITDSQFGIPSMDLFLQNLAISSNTNIVTATATTEAARQSYDVIVDQLATATKANSGYKQIETKYAQFDTELGTLGVKAGTITVNSLSFSINEKDTIQDLIEKFADIGVTSTFDQSDSTFTVNTALDKIDDGATGLKAALKLQDTTIQGATSGSLVYATRDSELYKLGITAGNVSIEGVNHTITKTGNNYTIKKDGAASATTINTLGQFLDYLKGAAVNAEEATIDDKGNITIRGAIIESVAGGSNIKDALNLGEVIERTIMQSNNLTFQLGHVADLTTKLTDLGITGNSTLILNGATTQIADTSTLQSIKDTLTAAGLEMTMDNQGVITIKTNGNSISGTILDRLGLEVNQEGTKLTSDPHNVTYKANSSTLLSTLGITNTMTYTAYKSDGTAITGTINNNAGLTIEGFINKLKGQGLNASFDESTHQITIEDGYITGDVANALGMTQSTVTHQEAATTATTLDKLGATGNQTLTIDGGTAKTYNTTTTLNTIITDITNAGGKVEFKDGIMSVSGVTLGGTLPGLLGFEATTQGTAVTSGAIKVVTNSSSTSTGSVSETTDNDIALTTRIGDITGSTNSYTLYVDGTLTNLTQSSTLQSISNAITAKGGTFKINDDNTISIEGVTLSGTIVSALGLASVGQGTSMSSNNPITVGGVENIVTADNTLKDLGATGNQTLIINGTTKTYANTTKLSTIFTDIQAAGGTAKIENGIINIEGVTLGGTAVPTMKLEATTTGSTVTSGNLTFINSTSSTSSSALAPSITNPITMSSTLGSITGATSNYTLSINGGSAKTYNSTTTLSTIRNDIQTAGGTMTIDENGQITIEGVSLSGTATTALQLTATSKRTSMSSNNPITMTQSFLIDGTTSIGGTGSNSLGVAVDRRDYAIYDTYGNMIKASSTDGTSGTGTINTWLAQINSAMNTHYGTTGKVYAEVANGIITIYDGYVTGSLPTAIGMKTESIVSGKQITGSVAKFEESNTKFIGKVSDQLIPEGAQRVSSVSSFTSGSTYYISDASDITKLASLVNGGANTSGVTFILTNNINMSSTTFTPIGDSSSHAFKGTFLGNGYTINDISYNNTASSGTKYAGLFGYTNGATIQDVGLINATINQNISSGGTSYTGGLIGYANNTTVENCFVNTAATGSYSLSSIAQNVYLGGLIGYAAGTTNINNSYSDTMIMGSTGTGQILRVGGLVGLFAGNTISNSFSTGSNVAFLSQGPNQAIGGFVGENRGTITNSYTTLTINSAMAGSDTSHPAYIGGFAGINNNGSITNSYANNSSQTIVSTSNLKIGGFLGLNSGSTTFSNNAYNKEIFSSDPGAIGNGTGEGIYGITSGQIAPLIPNLLGSNPTIDRFIYNTTTLSKMGLTTESDRTISITLDGTRTEKTFAANATVQDVVDYLNTITGITATFDDSVLKVRSETSQNISVGGRLGLSLMGDSPSESAVYETHTSAEKIYYKKNNVAISNATRVGDLIGSESTGTLNLLVNGTQVTLSYGADATISDIISDLAQYGINANVSSTGVFSFTSDDEVSIFGDIGRSLLGASGTVTYTNDGYESSNLNSTTNPALSSTTTLESLGINSGTIQIVDGNGQLINNIDIDNKRTLGEIASTLSAYGFNMSIDTTNKKVTIQSNGENKITDGSSNFVSGLKLNNWASTTTKLTSGTTLAQMGFANGETLSLILDGESTLALSFGANSTVQDIINSLSAFGITASIDSNGKFSATSNSHSFMFAGDLGQYLTNGSTGYVDKDIGFTSSETLKFNTSTTTLKADTTIEDLLGVKQDGILRITLNNGQIINLDYKSDDTVQAVIDDLANLGINATISGTGVFSAICEDKTFILSGNVGRALQGNAPTYNNFDNKYQSADLTFELTTTITNNSKLKDIGIDSGQVFVLDKDGNVIDSIDINNEMTIQQTKAALLSYGFNMGLDASGKITISSNDGYSLTDGSSNMISKFRLDNWTKTEVNLSTGTTLAQMGFKDGADLNILLDGTTPTSISFGATDTVQDIINSLQALGINASVNNTNGAFTAVSTEHSFVFSGDLGKFLTNGTAGYVNSDKGYITTDPLMVDVPVVTNTSEELKYSHALSATDTIESMGFADGGVIRLIIDGSTPYSFNFIGTDTMQDIMDTLATYGINTTIDATGKITFDNNEHTFTLGGALGSYLVQGGTYTEKDTGYVSDPLTFSTTEKITTDTKLSDLGVANGTLNILKDGSIAANNIEIDENTTIGQLFNAIKVYGMNGSILTDATTGDTSIYIYSEGDTVLTDGTSDVVTKLGLKVIEQGDYNSNITYWDTGVTSGLLTEDMLLTSLDKNGKTAVGSLIFETGTGTDTVQHIVNISATDTIGSFLEKLEDEGIHAILDNGVIKIDNSVYGLNFTGGTSGIFDTLGLTLGNLYTYASSNSSITYDEEVILSVANFADGNTTLDTVNVTDGKFSIYIDGVKAEIAVNSTDKFSDLFTRIVSEVGNRTGATVRAGFLDKDGNIVINPTTAQNTGIIAIEVDGDHSIVIGASNDTTNFATIANLAQESGSRVSGSRALYKVNVNSLVTGAGLFKAGNITAGTFTIGDAEFTIDATTTLNDLIKQINSSDKSYATAYWDTLSGTLVLQSTLTGESLINIEAGTSNFTEIMGFTKVDNGKETLVTDVQTLGKNAIVRINGTMVTSTSNVITSDISKIKGLTLNLKGLSNGEVTTVTVEQDDENIYNAVAEIIESYNALMTELEKEVSDGGSLSSEPLLKMLKNSIKRIMTQTLGGTTVFRNLAAIGISTGEAQDSISTDVTNLLIDKDTFMSALEKDSDAVKQLLAGTATNPGVFLTVGKLIDGTLTTSGYISTMEKTLNKNIQKLSDKISDANRELAHYRENLEKKFGNLELIVSNLQTAYSSFLGAG